VSSKIKSNEKNNSGRRDSMKLAILLGNPYNISPK
jgi:hypothetical protein